MPTTTILGKKITALSASFASITAGQTIMIINSDAYNAPFGGSYRPVDTGGNTLNALPGTTQTYVNIDGQWILVAMAPQ